MKEIQTWHERAMAHPDHQSGMVSEDMIRARMCEEIGDLRAEVERLTRERDEAWAVISTLEIVGKAADDERARLQKEIERLHKAHETACLGGELLRGEVERLRAYVTRILLIAHQNIVCRNECGQLCRDALEGKP